MGALRRFDLRVKRAAARSDDAGSDEVEDSDGIDRISTSGDRIKTGADMGCSKQENKPRSMNKKQGQ